MIINDQLDRIKTLHAHTWDTATAAALAAAIATIEGLPVTEDGAHFTVGDTVYESPHGWEARVAMLIARRGTKAHWVDFAIGFGDEWFSDPRPVDAHNMDAKAYSTAAAAKGVAHA